MEERRDRVNDRGPADLLFLPLRSFAVARLYGAVWIAGRSRRCRSSNGSEIVPVVPGPQFPARRIRPAPSGFLMPKPQLLETFPNPYADRDYDIYMESPEFTSLCPLGGIEGDATDLHALEGGAPDFATIRITYVPAEKCIELKSLKLYLWSFRNDGIFYERAVNRILDDLAAAVQPKSMEVVGDFNTRGGIKSIITARVSASR
jgi:7-cyano-7-deazaguanine reductase